MSETISMTDILLTVSVGCNLWFLFLLLYDRIMETKLVRFLRGIAGLWRSLGGTTVKQETVRETPAAEKPDRHSAGARRDSCFAPRDGNRSGET